MNKKRRVIQVSAAFLSVVFLLFAALVIHVGMVSVVRKNDQRIRQLSRIDFKQDINNEEASQIKGFVAGMNGVCGVNFNVDADILTYMYDPAVQSSGNVYTQLVAHGNYEAVKYTVNADDLAKGCPAFAEKGPLSRAVLYCSNLLFQ